MNFNIDPSKTQAGAIPAANAPAITGMPNFTFGAPGAGDSGKPGLAVICTAPQTKPGGLFSNSLSGTTPQTAPFNFGTPNAAVPAPGSTVPNVASPAQPTGLTFGTSVPPTTGINFGGASAATPAGFGTPAGSAPGFNLGSVTTATSGATTGLTFGTPKSGASTGFSLGGGENVSTTGTPALNVGTPNTTTTGFGFGSTGTAATPTTTTMTTATSFNLGNTPSMTTAPTFDAAWAAVQAKASGIDPGFGATKTIGFTSGFPAKRAPVMTTSSGFALGTATTTSTTPGFSIGGSTTATATTGFNLNKSTSVAAPTSLTATSTPTLGTTTTVSSSASGAQPGAINFCQVEESINKWTLDLEEQEKVFMNQATQVNAWDKLLITNGEKIVTLNQEVERVKIEQQQLEHELDYVVGQQKELQDCLVPLEKELASVSVSDPEREYTYRLAENLDTQLKQMSEDLKEIIEHLNEANRTQDSSDPIVQIGKILNAHMNSLQWLDQRTALLSQKIQQIDQMHQNFRQENERNFNLAYN